MLAQILQGGMENRPFNTQLRCYSALMCPDKNEEKLSDINYGGKILLPPSCLDWLTRLHIQYPMLFKLTNPRPDSQRASHCGVLEFLAEEGRCYLPLWLMKHLLLEEGQVVQIEYVSLPIATYAKFKPQSVEFLDITNPRVVLEMKLRGFACLTKGDIFPFEYNGKVYEILVTDVKPGIAVCIVECDMNLEFEAPEGYVEPARIKPNPSQTSLNSEASAASMTPVGSAVDLPSHAHPDQSFVPFSGQGNRLDGKSKSKSQQTSEPFIPFQQNKITPNLDYKPGSLNFFRNYRSLEARLRDSIMEDQNQQNFEAFKGQGATIRKRNQ